MIRTWLRILVWPIVSAVLLAGPAGALAATGQTPVTVSTEAAEIVYWPAAASPPAPAPRRLRAPPGIDEPGAAGWDLLNTGWSKEKKLKWLNVGILGGMMAYGLVYWGYGETSPQFVDEGWFEHDSIHGGADKLGHAISTYYAVQAFSSVYQRWGYDRHRANIYGSLSAETTFFMTSMGHGEPAMMPVRNVERSNSLKRGWSSSAMNIVGTPCRPVHFSACTVCSTVTGSKPSLG